MQSIRSKKKPKLGRWILSILILYFLFSVMSTKIRNINEKIIVAKGDNFSAFTENMSFKEKLKIKLYLYTHKDISLSNIQEGTYVFSGSYSAGDFLEKIMEGPTMSYIRYTILEGWSMYDIDADLTKKGRINAGDYIAIASDSTIIAKYKKRYDFLNNINLKNLEGFLYPDTYHIDADKNFSDQLIYMQLEAFKSKVWTPYSAEIINFNNKLQINGLNLTSLTMDPYKILTLASVVEKEERNNNNKPTVAGIFLKRLAIGMRLDADITLCYGLKQPYETCTPSFIGKNVSDKSNPFNTRQNGGIPSQPIANPSVSSITAVINYKSSNYLFYLHGSDGVIHYAKTIAEHNSNKQYLK